MFPSQRIEIKKRNKNWITSGIITFCKHKRELYNACRNNNGNQELLTYYKKYSKILSTVIKEAKKLNYADRIKKAPNKNKTIWNTINIESNKTDCSNTIRALNINGTLTNDGQAMANGFNEYFLSIARNITTKLNKHSSDKLDNKTPSH